MSRISAEKHAGAAVAPLVFVLVLVLVASPAGAADPPHTDVTVSGIHAGLMRVRGGDREGQIGTVGISTTHVGFGYERPFTIRVINTASIGFGGKSIQGGISNAVAGGVRAPVGKNHGVVLRGGIEGGIFGNKYLWNSHLELPQLQLGYQWLVPRSVAELAAKGGYVLLGRHNTGDAGTRDTGGSFEVGGIAATHIGALDLRASYTRIFVRHGGSPVDLLEGNFCGHASPLVVCTDVRYELGDARLPDDSLRPTHITYVGITLGLSILEQKRKPAPPAAAPAPPPPLR